MLVSAVIWRCFLSADPWFEVTPHEAGYSLTGAFVDTSSFGSQFKIKMKKQDEMDMLYLQGNKLCSRTALKFTIICNTNLQCISYTVC